VAALLDPPLLRRLEALALLVRRAVSGRMGGERRSNARGRSVEFADFRNYTPGDDFRLIDWNAYARLDRYMLRLFVAEQELPLSIFVDLSGSMDWGNPNKAATAKRLAGAIAYVALAALDRVRLTVFAAGPTSGGAPYRGRRAVAELFSRLESFPVGGPTDYGRLVWPIGKQRPGMTVLISDGLGESSIDTAIAALGRARQEGAILQLLAPQEIDRRSNIGYPGRNPVGIFAAARGIGRAVIIEAQNRQPGLGDRAGEVVHRSPATKFLVAEGAAKDDTALAWHRVKPADAIVKRDQRSKPPLPHGFNP